MGLLNSIISELKHTEPAQKPVFLNSNWPQTPIFAPCPPGGGVEGPK
jgi:hypothetical protein